MARKSMLDTASAFHADVGAAIGFTPPDAPDGAGHFRAAAEARIDYRNNSDAVIGYVMRQGAALDAVVAEMRDILGDHDVETMIYEAQECPEAALNLASLFLAIAARITTTCADYGTNVLIVHNTAGDPAI
jgi:hypothetical protein